MKRVSPILKMYKKKLEEIGIDVEYETSDNRFKFLIYFIDSHYQGFELKLTGNRPYKFSVVRTFNEGSSPSGLLIDATDDDFKRFIDSEIKDIQNSSKKHGGFRLKS